VYNTHRQNPPFFVSSYYYYYWGCFFFSEENNTGTWNTTWVGERVRVLVLVLVLWSCTPRCIIFISLDEEGWLMKLLNNIEKCSSSREDE
jgi:hypothetical protein